jgi:thymidylate kinase
LHDSAIATELKKKPEILALKGKGFLITISGIDGSGKSSNAVALYKSLCQRGLPVAHAWAGHKPALSYPIMALVRLLGYTRRVRITGIPFFRREVQNNSAISRLWPLVLALDFVPSALVSVALPLRRGKIIVCDRYVYDVVAELTQESALGKRTKRLLLNLLPHPDIAFLMDVDESLAWRRSLVPGRAREQPYYNLEVRRRIFLGLAGENGIIILNGGKKLAENQGEILHRTLRALGLPRADWS